MSEKRNKKVLFFLSSLAACMAVVLVLMVSFSPEAARAQRGRMNVYAAPVGSQQTYGGSRGGDIGRGGAAREVVLGDLPQASLHPSGPIQPRLRPLDGLTDEEYAAKKAAARNGGTPAKPGKASPQGGGPKSVGFSRGFFAQQEVCCTPPDMALAVGENFVVQFINTYIAVYDKNGNLQAGFPKAADSFFGLTSGTYTTDPRGFYDWSNHRFFFVMLTESNPTNPSGSANVGRLMVAVSQTYDPRGGWWVYNNLVSFPSGECPDYPTLGHDSNNWGTGATKGGFYIGINEFSGTNICKGSGFIGNYVFFFPKDPFFTGAGYSYWFFVNLFVSGTDVDTIQPANMTDRSDHPDAIFLINSYNILFSDPQNGLAVWSVSGPTSGAVVDPNNPFAFLQGGNGPVLTFGSTATTHNYSFPPGADEPNATNTATCANCIDTGDKRISGQVKYHAGEIFGALETGVSGGTAGPIWFDVHPVVNNNNSQITSVDERQEDCFVCGGWVNHGSAYYATLQPDQENNLVMVFEFSTASATSGAAYPSMVYTSRRVTYGDSLMNGVGNFFVGGAAFYFQSCNSVGTNCRWGDYTAMAPDLTIANFPTMWFSGIYANGSGNWGTAIGEARYHFPQDQ